MSLNALAPVSPKTLYEIFCLSGYAVIVEDSYNWVLAQAETDIPIVLPKRGAFVPLEILMDTVFTKAGMDLRTYLILKLQVEQKITGPIH